MADGVAITAGTGTTILTDETASGHAQVMKLAISTDASAVLIPATADGLAVVLRPEATGGLSTFRSLDLDESEEEVKASAGQVYGYYFSNVAASARFLKFYNATAASVTVGSTTPLLTLPLPAAAAANVEFPHGIAFSTAITVAATTGVADADTGAPSANDVVINLFYK
jgi:hypothetical protein